MSVCCVPCLRISLTAVSVVRDDAERWRTSARPSCDPAQIWHRSSQRCAWSPVTAACLQGHCGSQTGRRRRRRRRRRRQVKRLRETHVLTALRLGFMGREEAVPCPVASFQGGTHGFRSLEDVHGCDVYVAQNAAMMRTARVAICSAGVEIAVVRELTRDNAVLMVLQDGRLRRRRAPRPSGDRR